MENVSTITFKPIYTVNVDGKRKTFEDCTFDDVMDYLNMPKIKELRDSFFRDIFAFHYKDFSKAYKGHIVEVSLELVEK